jgi:hypothetical protein
MKKIFLFSTRLRVFLTEIPLLFLLGIVISVHDSEKAPPLVKFYPLEILIVAVCILIVVYFFRAVLISKDEIRQIGRFSSRDKATIEEGKTLVLTLAEKKHLTVELYESDESKPSLPFASEYAGRINLFREKTRGNKRTVHRILTYFGLDTNEASSVIEALPKREISYESIAVRAEEKHDVLIFYIRMLETL